MKGSYLLLITVGETANVEIGALDEIIFKAGSYVYIGSAQSGLQARVSRHLGQDKRLHWHIDYLLARQEAEVKDVFAKKTKDKQEECRLANKVSEIGQPVKDFGCSDCSCDSHLFRIENESELKQLLAEAGYSPYQPK